MTQNLATPVLHATGRNYNPRHVRNYFLAGKDSKDLALCRSLTERRLMRGGQEIGWCADDSHFTVTEEGEREYLRLRPPKSGRIITKSLRPTKGPYSPKGELGFIGTKAWGRRVRLFRTPEDIRVGQPVLLLIRPHGKYCGCEPTYSAGVEMLGKYPDFEKARRTK